MSYTYPENYEQQLRKDVQSLVDDKKISEYQGTNTVNLYMRYRKYIQMNQSIDWAKVNPIPDQNMKVYEQLKSPSDDETKDALK